MTTLLIAVAVVGLWVAAVAFGRDTRDGADWFTRAAVGERSPRLGD
jgi:hypothetical protein